MAVEPNGGGIVVLVGKIPAAHVVDEAVAVVVDAVGLAPLARLAGIGEDRQVGVGGVHAVVDNGDDHGGVTGGGVPGLGRVHVGVARRAVGAGVVVGDLGGEERVVGGEAAVEFPNEMRLGPAHAPAGGEGAGGGERVGAVGVQQGQLDHPEAVGANPSDQAQPGGGEVGGEGAGLHALRQGGQDLAGGDQAFARGRVEVHGRGEVGAGGAGQLRPIAFGGANQGSRIMARPAGAGQGSALAGGKFRRGTPGTPDLLAQQKLVLHPTQAHLVPAGVQEVVAPVGHDARSTQAGVG